MHIKRFVRQDLVKNKNGEAIRMRKVKSLSWDDLALLVMPIGILLGSVCPAAGQLSIEIVLARTTVCVGQPIVGCIRLSNNGAVPYVVMSRIDPAFGETSIIVRQVGQDDMVIAEAAHFVWMENNDLEINPGEILVGPLCIVKYDGQFVAGSVGAHTVTIRHGCRYRELSGGPTMTEVLESNRIVIYVEQPRADYDKYALLLKDCLSLFSADHGALLEETNPDLYKDVAQSEYADSLRLLNLYTWPIGVKDFLHECNYKFHQNPLSRDLVDKEISLRVAEKGKDLYAELIWDLARSRLGYNTGYMSSAAGDNRLIVDRICRDRTGVSKFRKQGTSEGKR